MELKAIESGEDVGSKSLWNPSYVFLMLVSLITAIGFNMVYIIISKYATGITTSLTIVGLVSGIFAIAALLIRPFAGLTADTVNKKSLCIAANLVIGISVVGYSFSHNIPMLMIFRILHGAAFGVSSTVNIALVTRYIPKERLGEGLGYYGLGQVVAQVISPNLSVMIEGAYGFQRLFLLIAIMSFVGAAMLVFLRYPKTQKPDYERKKKLSLHDLVAKEVIVYAAVGGLFSFGNGIISSFLILLGDERKIGGISLFFSVGAVVIFLLRIFAGRIVDRQGLTLLVNISLLVTAMSMGLIGFSPVLSLLLIASVLKSIGQGVGHISLQTECIKRVDAARVGVATSTFYIGADIGQGVGPMIGGAITSHFNYTVLFLGCAILMIISMLFFNLYQRKMKLKEENCYERV